MKRGFTLIELAIVIVIMGLLSLVVYPFLSRSTGTAELNRAKWELTDNLRRAQVQSMAGQDNTTWGIHFDTTDYILFGGAAFNPVDPDNIQFDLPAKVTITLTSINGGGDEIIFDRATGKTVSSGTIELTDSLSSDTATITVTAEGRITYD